VRADNALAALADLVVAHTSAAVSAAMATADHACTAAAETAVMPGG
jgi:hypothetical protein